MSSNNPLPYGERPSEPAAAPRLPAPLRRRIHAETHDVYLRDETPHDDLVDACAALYRELRFDEGLARARRDAGWERDRFARLYVGIGLHYQRRYDDARAEYVIALELADTPFFRATCLSNVGTTWFEQGDLARALECFDRALVADPDCELGYLNRIAVACQRSDADAVVEGAARVVGRWPDWAERPVIASMLLKDRSFRFAREHDGLFERAFGVALDALLPR